MSFGGVLALAIGALWGKKGRNLLTLSGVAIGVFALTMIVALGQGLRSVITDTVASDGNLRQIRMMGGTGVPQKNSGDEIEITGDMSETRRMRLRRSALNRQRIRRSVGRRATLITDDLMKKVSELEHVESVRPIVTERYRLAVGDHTDDAVVSFGVDVDRDRYRDRVMTGDYFSSNDANEVILHEYLLYQWGLISREDQETLIGTTLTLKTIDNSDAKDAPQSINPLIAQLAQDLNQEEQDALKRLLPKVLKQFSGSARATKPVTRQLKVVGILREFQTGEPFNVVEDTNSAQADIYLPHESARALFLSAAINTELGYSSALVTVDHAEYAADVEQTLRDLGYTAFSVAGILKQIETTLTVVTIMVAFLTGIALLVSTLGIVNTMVTSVLERTREIGIYKAIGASDRQVMSMFLIESCLIGLIGGLLGLGIAALATLPGDTIAAKLIADRAAVSFDKSVFVMPAWLIVSGPLLGTVTAVIAAYIPAKRAACIDPVKALRHD
jgi:putative ABC transport system permease protein